jgi:hypothetical protein
MSSHSIARPWGPSRYGRARRASSALRVAGIGVVVAAAAMVGVLLATGGGAASSLMLSADADNAAVDCTLVVPPNPLSAQGLATPYRLSAANGGACHEANPDQSAFVQATIIDPATGALSVYNPLVLDQRVAPAVAPVVPALPRGAVVGIWFGFNGDNLKLARANGHVTVRRGNNRMNLRGAGSSIAQGRCVNGLPGSIFGQFADCNGAAFFQAAYQAVKAGRLVVPAPGRGTDGLTCPTVRDFGIVDQDQSDNVTATYLVTGNGATAQATAANMAALPGAATISNGSDNGLLVNFVDKAVGCSPFTAPDLANGGTPATALALDEIQAQVHQTAPIALVPPNDPMTVIGDAYSRAKTNLYRREVGQPLLGPSLRAESRNYCATMLRVGKQRILADQAADQAFASPDTGAASNLFTFLGMRLMQAFDNLGCGDLLGINNPIAVRTNGDIAVGVTFNKPTRVSAHASASAGTATDAAVATGSAAPVTPTAAATTSPAAGVAASASPAAGVASSRSPAASPSARSASPAPMTVPSASPAPTADPGQAAGAAMGAPTTSPAAHSHHR